MPPWGGNLSVQPPSGVELSTSFNLTLRAWSADALPLRYRFFDARSHGACDDSADPSQSRPRPPPQPPIWPRAMAHFAGKCAMPWVPPP
mmetsp:Transcript_33687/g.92304  ORF Transcript_33687/g.92304 Transcript_33687/m.92304 type:complete len:89 (-) Transcript_33687:1509-1775(-)